MKVHQSIRLFCLVVFAVLIIVTSFTKSASAQNADTTQVPIVITTPHAIQRFDDAVMISLAESRTPGQTRFLRFISNNNLYGNIGIPAGMFIGGVIGKDQQLRQNALFVASSTAFSFLSTSLIKRLVKRRRPYVQNVKIIPVYQARHWSFPSGHSSAAFATASSLASAYPKWYVIAPSYLWAGTIAYSRMYLGVHYPTDVTSGAIVGGVSTIATKGLRK